MRRTVCSVVIAAMLVLAMSAFAGTTSKSMTWTGWISDSNCAAKGMNAKHRDCALKCVKEKGAKWVFVNSKTKQVFAIHNQDAVKESDLGQQVKLTGHVMDDKSLHVESTQPAR